MLGAIKHLVILGVIFSISLYIHNRFATIGIEYGSYKVIASPGVIFFALLYLLLLLLLFYSAVVFVIRMPQRWRNQRQCVRCEHGMIALVEAFIGILAENLSATKMFYGKARSLLGDIPEVIAIKAYTLLMEQKKEKSYMEFAKLLNYRDTRLLAIKCLSANFSNLSLGSVVDLAGKSLPETYQPVWFRMMALDSMMQQKEWIKAIDYVNSIDKNIKGHFLQHKAQCLYQAGALCFKEGELRKAENFIREAIQCAPDNIELIIQYSRVMCRYVNNDQAKKFLLEEYGRHKSEKIANELLRLAGQEVEGADKRNKLLHDVLQINGRSYVANVGLFDAAIADRRYGDAEIYASNMLQNTESLSLGRLMRLKLFLFTEAYEDSVSALQHLEPLIEEQKSKMLLQESQSDLFRYNALEIT